MTTVVGYDGKPIDANSLLKASSESLTDDDVALVTTVHRVSSRSFSFTHIQAYHQQDIRPHQHVTGILNRSHLLTIKTISASFYIAFVIRL